MSIAEQTRKAVHDHPFLYEALRAGVVNYTEAARFLDIGDEETVGAALRRYGKELPSYEAPAGDARVTMKTGLGRADDGLFVFGNTAFDPGEGSLTGVLAVGDVSPAVLRVILARCEAAGMVPEAAGVADDALLVVVQRRDGPETVQLVEAVCGIE